MAKFEIGQIVRGKGGHLYIIEDNAVDVTGKRIYFLRRVVHDYIYQYEEELMEFNGQIVS